MRIFSLLSVDCTSGALHCDDSGFDVDLDCGLLSFVPITSVDIDESSILARSGDKLTIVWNRQGLLRMNVLHCRDQSMHMKVRKWRVGNSKLVGVAYRGLEALMRNWIRLQANKIRIQQNSYKHLDHHKTKHGKFSSPLLCIISKLSNLSSISHIVPND